MLLNNQTNIPVEGGGTEVVANPTLSGNEPVLQGLQVGNSKYQIPNSSELISIFSFPVDEESVDIDNYTLKIINADKFKQFVDRCIEVGGFTSTSVSEEDPSNPDVKEHPAIVRIPLDGICTVTTDGQQDWSTANSFLEVVTGTMINVSDPENPLIHTFVECFGIDISGGYPYHYHDYDYEFYTENLSISLDQSYSGYGRISLNNNCRYFKSYFEITRGTSITTEPLTQNDINLLRQIFQITVPVTVVSGGGS